MSFVCFMYTANTNVFFIFGILLNMITNEEKIWFHWWYFNTPVSGFANGHLHINEQISDVTAGSDATKLTEFLVFSKVRGKVYGIGKVWIS